MNLCLGEQDFNLHSSENNQFIEGIVKEEKEKFEYISWDDYINYLFEYIRQRAILRRNEIKRYEVKMIINTPLGCLDLNSKLCDIFRDFEDIEVKILKN